MGAKVLSRKMVFVMAAGAGVTIANLYFCQPVLADIATSLHVSSQAVKWIPALTQLGAAGGILFMVPLGDRIERCSLTVRVTLLLAIASLLMAVAPGYKFLLGCSLLLGLFCCVPHLILPIATLLAPPKQSGRVISTVMSGLLIGVLSGRTIAGFVGSAFGWRAVYWLATALTLTMAWLISNEIPECPPRQPELRYLELLLSAARLFAKAEMREAAFIGGMLFGAFNAFWTTLVFLLATPPYHYGASMAGTLGILAVASALAAPIMGKIVDRFSARVGVGCAILLLLSSFGVLYAVGLHLWGLAIGIVMLDVAAQSGHIANLARVYGTFAEARSRAGTAYMVCFFAGGSMGSCLGGWGWTHHGWRGVTLVGAAMATAAFAVHLWSCRRTHTLLVAESFELQQTASVSRG